MQKMHITNVLRESELYKKAVVAKFATTADDGNKRSGALGLYPK